MTLTIAKDSDLATKSGPELVTIYNSLAQKLGIPLTQRFASRDIGVRRIVMLLSENPSLQIQPVMKLVPKETTTKVEKPKGESKAVSDKGRPFNLPNSLTKRPFRPNGGRGKLIAALREGRTFEQLLSQFPQWDADRLAYTIRKLSKWLGFGVKEEGGVIRLFD